MATRNTSMKDVALLAGVSIGTVSNVLNRPDQVTDATRNRVQDAIAKLGWVRNESARQLRAGRSHSIGLVVMDVANPFFTDLTRGVEEIAQKAGYAVLLGNSGLSPEREGRHLQQFGQQRVSGVVLAPIGDDLHTDALQRFGIPVVVADQHANTNTHCTVSVDDFLGGQLAASHLLENGHRRIAVAGGTTELRQVRDRREGASRALLLSSRDATLLTLSTPTLDIAGGRIAAETITALLPDERPTGVFATNDLVAIGLLQGLFARDIRVPDDIAIIGYDDIEYTAAAAVPLSSIRQPRADLGRRAAELLLAEIEAAANTEGHQHEQVVFTPELVIRKSSDFHATVNEPLVPSRSRRRPVS